MMAGSYRHLDPTNNGHWSLIENMGDAYEAVEELLFLVRCLGNDEDIRKGLKQFHVYRQGECDPACQVVADGSENTLLNAGKAYLEMRSVMDDKEEAVKEE